MAGIGAGGGGGGEKTEEESDFSPIYSRGHCRRAFHSGCHVSFPTVCMCACVRELCEGPALLR